MQYLNCVGSMNDDIFPRILKLGVDSMRDFWSDESWCVVVPDPLGR